MKCNCGRDIEEARVRLLNSDKCSVCASNINTGKVKGIMVWTHKTAPTIQIVDSETHSQYKKDTDRKGQKSILRTKSPNMGKAI